MGRLPEQTVEQFEEGSRRLARLGSLFVSLAGGEPLLRPDIVDIVRAVARWHLPFITTQGWFATPALARQLFDAGLWGVSISIDYANPQRHERARSMKGCHEKAVRALEHFSAARRHKWQRVNLLAVLLNDNLDEIEDLIRLAADREAYFMVQPYCELKTGLTRYHCAGRGVSARLLELRRKYPNFLSNPVFLSKFDQFLNGGVPGCRAGRAFFNIDSVGDVAICVEERPRPVANLYRDAPRQIVSALRRAAAGNTCQACWYNCRGETESLYSPISLWHSLPTYFLDRGRPPRAPQPTRAAGPTRSAATACRANPATQTSSPQAQAEAAAPHPVSVDNGSVAEGLPGQTEAVSPARDAEVVKLPA